MNLAINGDQLAYEESGRAWPPLVLIHGLGLDRSIWRVLASQYMGDQQVILPDLRGHGGSDATPGPYSMTRLAKDLAYLLDSLGIQKAIVCGHSMGGYVSLAFAEQFPQMLAGLGLITTNAKADPEDKRAGRYAMIQQVEDRGTIAMAESLAPKLSSNQVVISQAYDLISKTHPVGIIGALEGMAERPDRIALLQEIHVPALVVAGESDLITDFDDAKAMAESLPDGQFLGLPGVGHMPMAEAVAELGQGLRSLIARVLD